MVNTGSIVSTISQASQRSTIVSTLLSTSGGSSPTVTISRTSTLITTKWCEEIQAIDSSIIKNITISPNDISEAEKAAFRPTSSQGVSFPSNNRAPTIFVELNTPTEVQSITIPRDKTSEANVQQFEVTFYAPNNIKINDRPVLSNLSPRDDRTKPAQLDAFQIPSTTLVSRIEITIVLTTDSESPSGVILDIKVCKKPTTSKRLYCDLHSTRIFFILATAATMKTTSSTYSKETTVSRESTTSDKTTIGGATIGTTVSGATTRTTAAGATTESTVSSATTGTTASGATTESTVSGATTESTVSGATDKNYC